MSNDVVIAILVVAILLSVGSIVVIFRDLYRHKREVDRFFDEVEELQKTDPAAAFEMLLAWLEGQAK